MDKLILGSHVKMSKANSYLLGAFQNSLDYGANTFMIYTGAPQNTKRVPVDDFFIADFQNLMANHKWNYEHLVIHAPYIINLANTFKPYVFNLAVDFLTKEIARAEAIGIKLIVLHPGSAVGADPKKGLDQIIKGLNLVLKPEHNVKIALETMAGKGSELGRTFAELQYIIDNVKLREKVGVCWDTCHLADADYNLQHDLEAMIKEFADLIGLDKLWVFHINDSKNPQGSRKDRHANIGYGYVGFQTLLQVVHHPLFQDIPKILETPYLDNKPPYKAEIKMLRTQKFTDPFALDVLVA